MPSSPVTSLSLRGSAGSLWFRDRGIIVSDFQGLQLYVNEVRDGTMRLTRVWHSSVTAEVRIPVGDSSLVFLQIEGTSVIEVAEWAEPSELKPGGFAIFPAGTAFLMRSESEIARYETEFDLRELPLTLRESVASGVVENEPMIGYRQLVLGSANSALNFGLTSAEAGFSYFLRGFTSFLTALVVQSLDDRRSAQPRRAAELYESAIRVIEREFKDPLFSVADLAVAVGVSPRYLRRIFEHAGTSPKSALREARLRAANHYIDARSNGSPISRETVANLSGFSDARSLRRAIEQHERRVDPRADGQDHRGGR